MKRRLSAALFFAAATVLGFAASAGAVDGTIEINQAKVLAGGGFPYVISTANTSYRLTGSLTVPASTNGINVTAPNVTIDLNGFSIVGPGSTTGIGINAPGENEVTVENGAVTGFSGSGLGVQIGSFGIVRHVHADANSNGIQVGNNTAVEGCTANNSGATGISCAAGCAISGNVANGSNFGITCAADGCVISGNTANDNKDDGVFCAGKGCLISGNTADNNEDGIVAADATTGYGGNVANGNHLVDTSGGTSLGHNLCSGVVC
jgi:parallel beta-helix repeat protein